MDREGKQETPKQTHSGVVTRSKRKSSLMLRESDEGGSPARPEGGAQKRAQISSDARQTEKFEDVQSMFGEFIAALNSQTQESISDRVKRGARRKMLSNGASEAENLQERPLKRVKQASRKAKKVKEDGRKGGRKGTDLEPITEDVTNENRVNCQDSEIKAQVEIEKKKESAQSENEEHGETQDNAQQSVKANSQKQISEKNFNGKIPEKAPVSFTKEEL